MKKTLVFVILLILLSFTAVSAQETDVIPELSWEVVEPILTEEQIPGQFHTFDEVALQIWIPSVLQRVELTDQDREEGYIGYFTTAEQDAAVAVTYMDAKGTDLEGYAEKLHSYDDVAEIAYLYINDLPALSYTVPEQDTMNVTFATDAGYLLEFTFYPISDEGFRIFSGVITASIQPEN